MAKKDKDFFDYSRIANDEWARLAREAMKDSSIFFDRENDDIVDQDVIEMVFDNDDDDPVKVLCELRAAGGDWQSRTYYFRCQAESTISYEVLSKQMFCVIPGSDEGNSNLVPSETDSCLAPLDADEDDSERDEKEDEKACWNALPSLLKSYVKLQEKKREASVAMRGLRNASADDLEIVSRRVPISCRLTVPESGEDKYAVLEVSEELKQAVFRAIETPEMVIDSDHRAHISAFTDDEFRDHPEIADRDGCEFVCFLKSVCSVEPEGWDEMERVWFVTVDCPGLEEFRRIIGLTPKMHGDHEFHMTVALKPKGE